MNITPSPRMLRMLGEIEFAQWQCIAELVDNAFDDFSEIWSAGDLWPGGYKVVVTLPSAGAPLAGAELEVRDTGRGMSTEQLQSSVKAGFSTNDRFDKLGLFGMGFNVSTARLGSRTRVLTTRDGDPTWTGVEIDFDTLGSDFEAPDVTRPKDDLSDHGTSVIVSRLKPDHAEWLSRNADGLRNTLGRLYSWLLSERPFELWVQGVRVKPRKACRWGDDRYVVFGGGAERIPAYIPIDQSYPPADACDDCGNFQEPDKGKCDRCGSAHLRQRERRIHGWLGIQRHLDKREFGIDFLRNGRKILQNDKRLFEWTNPNDPLAAVDVEYPIELGASQGGRIIGEIHLDHVPVVYQKNAFDYGDRSWRAAVDFLRGIGPLLPQKAKLAGYPENTSPLALLIKGFRRNDPGSRCLIPGDGSRPIHEETRRWAREFWAGNPDYQSDERWYQAVLNHDARQAAAKQSKATGEETASPDEAAVLEALGVTVTSGVTDDPPASEPVDEPVSETQQERLGRYRKEGVPLPELTRDFGVPDLGNLKIETFAVPEPSVLDAQNGPTPVWLAQGSGGTATAIVAASHPVFAKFGADAGDLVLVEVAGVLKVRASSDQATSQVVARLRMASLPDTAVDAAVIGAQARELLAEIRQRMAARVSDDPGRAVAHLTPDELTYTENAMIADGVKATGIGTDAWFLLYVPPLFLVTLLEAWPEAFLDGRVFVGSFATLSSPSSRRLSLARVAGYLNDLATLLTFQTTPSPDQLKRTRLSIQLLANELAADE